MCRIPQDGSVVTTSRFMIVMVTPGSGSRPASQESTPTTSPAWPADCGRVDGSVSGTFDGERACVVATKRGS